MENGLNEEEISITVSEEPHCRRTIAIEVAPERFREEKERVLRAMLGSVSVPGFRKGKVPVDVVRRRFAEEIRAEALKSILPAAYGHAVSAGKINPIGDPVFSEIDAADEGPVSFRVAVEVIPSINLSGYRGVEVPAEDVAVGDEEVDSVLARLREREAEFSTVDRPAVKDDVVVVDYAPLKRNGAVNEKKRVADYPVLIGSGTLLPAFEEAVTGKAAGTITRVAIDYPADFRPERLAGKTVTYEITVKEVKEKRLLPLDDALAARIDPECASVDALREKIRERLRADKEQEARRKREEAAIDLIIERNPFEVPRSMLERFTGELAADDERRRRAYGAPPVQDTDERRELDALFDRMAMRSIKRYFVIEHIADVEKLEVTDEDVRSELERIASESGKPIGEVEKVFSRGNEHLSKLRDNLRERKVFAVILGGGGA